jgi:DNA-binding NtrC family response regulator/tetratricopeptide (TPR) repeat protein
VPAAASPLAAARWTDRRRVAVLLQAAAVLAHLDAAGWHLGAGRPPGRSDPAEAEDGTGEGAPAPAGGWEAATVSADGILRLPPPAPGRGSALHQDLLLDLVERLFGDATVPGRGEGRKAARGLARRWRRAMAPLDADAAVGEILEHASFLWQPAFAAARGALAGRHRRADRWRWRVAGPPHHRRRLERAARDGEASVAELLAGDDARLLWAGSAALSAGELSAAGRWRAQVARWSDGAPAEPEQRLELAAALFSLGRFERALDALHGLRRDEARLLRARCQYRLGRLRAAAGTARRLRSVQLAPELLLRLAEVAVRIDANLGKIESARQWVRRAHAAAGALAPRAHLLSALVEWDGGQPERMARHLEAARPLLTDPRQAWKWRFGASLAAAAAGDVEGALGELSTALRAARRRLRPFEAGQLWNEVGICRARLGDLAGAERAFGHTVRLLVACDGPRATTLGLYNLAEIRLRRGRLAGVGAILEEATLENRLSDNVRGGIQDAELWVRLELAQGRPRAAYDRCRRALDRLEELGLDWRRAELATLAARALGWMGETAPAAAMLALPGAPVTDTLEAEELPALWAHAGDRDAALRAASATALSPFWMAVLTGDAPSQADWSALDSVEPYRAARLIFDVERLAPGVTPVHWLRRAVATLRRMRAGGLAARLEARDRGPWAALAHYLDASRPRAAAPRGGGPASSEEPALPAGLVELFQEVGYGDVSLCWVADTPGSAPRRLIAGAGGDARRTAVLDGGELVLRAPAIDDVLQALFALAVRDVRAPRAAAHRAQATPRGGMVGDSSRLRAAQERLARLAPGDMPMLILGESGTGKELAARLVHRLSPRRDRPFVAINCAALSETLLLSDLFGHVRGSFTGADRERAGVFETARGGTVFLDEIGDLPASAQGMLLRVLQEGEVRRVGESLPRRVDVRVLSATHRDLSQMVEQTIFRGDLYFRLKVARIELPPLRDRGEDLLSLADHFLHKLSEGQAAASARLGTSAIARLQSYPWPGNIRELENVMTVAFALSGAGGVIEEQHLDLPKESSRETPSSYHQQVDALRRRLLTEAVAAAAGNQAQAARSLGLTRQALAYLVKQLEIV